MKDNKTIAHRKTYRKQQMKTYSMRVLMLPKWLIGGLALVIMFITWTSLGKMIKSSNAKLSTQKELYKPVKKEHKLNKKELKKDSYNVDKGVDINV